MTSQAQVRQEYRNWLRKAIVQLDRFDSQVDGKAPHDRPEWWRGMLTIRQSMVKELKK